MNLKINKIDFILTFFIVFIFLISLFGLDTLTQKAGEEKVNIYYLNSLIYSVSLYEDKEILLKEKKYEKFWGDILIEIKDGRVRVKEETSPFNYCSIQGWVSMNNRPIICLPNGLLVIIEVEEIPKYDEVVYCEH